MGNDTSDTEKILYLKDYKDELVEYKLKNGWELTYESPIDDFGKLYRYHFKKQTKK